MPADLITIKALAKELNNKLYNGRIDKISQPENDEINISLRVNNKSHLLVLSANNNYPRAHITTTKKLNPYIAPTFCMLLRKHLANGIINSVDIINNDRIIKISITARNELFDTVNLSIIVELMGRYSNIILLNAEDKIIDAIRHNNPEDSKRIVLPNIKYSPPPQDKISIDDYDKINQLLSSYSGDDWQGLVINNISGFSKATANELIHKTMIKGDDIARNIISEIDTLNNINDTQMYKPCALKTDDKLKDYYIYPYTTIKGEFKYYNSLNEALDDYYSTIDIKERLKNHSKNLVTLVKNHIKRNEKALHYAKEKLVECENMQDIRENGDMILANIYKIKKGMSNVQVDNYFTGGVSVIPLDATLSPQDNAAKYYKKYSKLARSKGILTKQVEDLSYQIEYLNSLLQSLELAITVEDVMSVKDELIDEGILKVKNTTKKGKNITKSQPRIIKIEGFKVYVGRNNLDNEHLTFKIAQSNDIFLHAKNIFGSHVIIIADGKTVVDTVIEKAAKLAAYYSAGRNTDKVAVDYTLRRYVRKHPSKKKGMVIYTDYSTIIVKPENLLLRY